MKLELINVNKSFGDKHVLKDISLTAESGKALGLLGRNGAGKTTTIRIIMDVFAANSGDILVNGKPISHKGLRIGYLPEERGLYPKRKIIDQLIYLAMLKGMNKKEATASVDYWLGRLEMTEHRNKPLDTLSKGNQQKIQLISAIASNPEIVILDEPFSGLDPVNAILLESVVKELIQSGKIVIFSSHQMNYIQEFCQEIAIINNGEIVLHGDLQNIIKSYPRDSLLVQSAESENILSDLSLSKSRFQYVTENMNTNQSDELTSEAPLTAISSLIIDIFTTNKAEELIVKMQDPQSKQAVMKSIFEKYDVDSISVYEPSLNDIFVQYTKEDMKND